MEDLLKEGIVIGDYQLKKVIGEGSFASCWLAEHTQAHKLVAIKIISHRSLTTEEAMQKFHREVNLIMKMDHPFICQLFEIIQDKFFTFLIMEYAENGNLLNFVNDRGRLPESQARRYFSQLLSALEYLHDVRYVAHRDLKAENVLLDKNNNIRLIDFGLSNIFTDDNPELSTACGSPPYASPEMITGRKYTKAADVWSSGVLLYAMVVGELPFNDDDIQALLQQIAFCDPPYPSFLSAPLIDLLSKILCKDPEQRLTIRKIKEHPWFSQSEYTKILDFGFSADQYWLVNGIDKEIVKEIASLGVDVKTLPQSLMCNEFGNTTSLYRLLRREQITNNIKEMMECLTSPAVQFGMTGPKNYSPIPLPTRLHITNETQSTTPPRRLSKPLVLKNRSPVDTVRRTSIIDIMNPIHRIQRAKCNSPLPTPSNSIVRRGRVNSIHCFNDQ